jgi:hypothetical protein
MDILIGIGLLCKADFACQKSPQIKGINLLYCIYNYGYMILYPEYINFKFWKKKDNQNIVNERNS